MRIPQSFATLTLSLMVGIVLLDAGFLGVTAIGQDQSAVASKKSPPPENQAINEAMQRFIESNQMAGAVTLVGHQGKIVHLGAVGYANLESEKKMKKSSLFSIASMTKPITATALMILQDEGKLNVEDNVSKYIPAFKEMKLKTGEAAEREITIRDCLTHTAGLTGSQLFDGSLQETVEELAKNPLAFQPGTKWQYSPGLNVAGRIVEVVSGQPFDQFLQQRIFDPASMNVATFFPNEKQQARIATIYQRGESEGSLVAAGNRIAVPGKINAPNPSGGLFATARDMFRFYQMILNDGKLRGKQIVSAESVNEMTSPKTGDLETGFTPGNCWGLGWCIVREPQGVTEKLSPGTFGHGGAFGTQGWVDPKTETVYVLMIQRTKMGNSDGSDIRKAFHAVANEALNIK